MFGSAREDMGRLNMQGRFIFQESRRVESGDFSAGLTLFAGLGNQFIFAPVEHFHTHMAHIGYILDVDDLVTAIFEGPAQPIGHRKSPQVPYMDIAINCWAAAI